MIFWHWENILLSKCIDHSTNQVDFSFLLLITWITKKLKRNRRNHISKWFNTEKMWINGFNLYTNINRIATNLNLTRVVHICRDRKINQDFVYDKSKNEIKTDHNLCKSNKVLQFPVYLGQVEQYLQSSLTLT